MITIMTTILNLLISKIIFMILVLTLKQFLIKNLNNTTINLITLILCPLKSKKPELLINIMKVMIFFQDCRAIRN